MGARCPAFLPTLQPAYRIGKSQISPPHGSKSSLLNPGPSERLQFRLEREMPIDKQTMIRLRLDPPILTVWFIFASPNPENAGQSTYLIRDYARFVHFEMDIAIIRSLLFLKLRRRRISGQKTTSRSLPGWLLPSLSRVILICRFEQSKRDGLRGPTATIS